MFPITLAHAEIFLRSTEIEPDQGGQSPEPLNRQTAALAGLSHPEPWRAAPPRAGALSFLARFLLELLLFVALSGPHFGRLQRGKPTSAFDEADAARYHCFPLCLSAPRLLIPLLLPKS